MLLARLLVNRSALPLAQAYHGLVLTTASRIGRPDAWTACDALPPLCASLPLGASSSVLTASGIPGAGGISGGAAGSASAERSTGLPGTATGGATAAETSTGLGGPSGRSAEADVGLRSPTDAASAEGAVGQSPPVPDADAEAVAGGSGVGSSTAEHQPGDRPPEPSGAGGAAGGGSGDAVPEGSPTDGEQVLRKAAAAAEERETGAATATAAGGSGQPPGDGDEPETVITSTRSDPFFYSLITPFHMLRGMLAAMFVKRRIELDFQLDEFLESAKDAFYMVQKLFMQGDLEALQPMVSPAVLEAFRSTNTFMAATNTRFKLLEHVVGDAWLSTIQLRSAEDFSRLVAPTTAAADQAGNSTGEHQERAGAGAHPAAGMFLVATVHFSGTMRLQRDAPGVREILTDRQSQVWSFARGPLPETMPARKLESDWMLVGIA